jgi:glycosyltransferase involved in cell wall biosynthesis
MNAKPLVTVICTTFNQADYVLATLDSLLSQEYQFLEIKIVDNGSTDATPQLLIEWFNTNRHALDVELIIREEPLPYCASFNKVFSKCKGRYLIDLSGDDLILPGHIFKSVQTLSQNQGAALCFSDVLLCTETGHRKTFYQRDEQGKLLQQIPTGDIYEMVVARLMMLSVSYVFDAAIFRDLGGYDEQLTYEDFDITIRMARDYRIVFSDHIGVAKTIHNKSWSQQQYRPKNSTMLPSTLKVCEKIAKLNRLDSENEALLKRILFECKHALWSANFEAARGFLELARRLGYQSLPLIKVYHLWAQNEWDFSGIYLFIKRLIQR